MKLTPCKQMMQISFLPHLFPVNCYLVELEEELILIDAALPYSAKGILKAVRQMGKPLSTLVLTHAHDDHVGALVSLKEALPDVQIVISERDSRLLAGDRSLNAEEPQTPIRGSVPKGIRTKADRLLRDGDRVGPLLAISCPGHTPGSMSFYDERTGSLIAGDAFQLRGGIAVSGRLKPAFPFPALATWNAEEAVRSARKLIEWKPTLLAVGHGRVLPDPVPAMQKAIAEAERAIEAGRNTVAKGGGKRDA
ncbi:MBL fold metallo-hydrolase [Paenibacillus physcomitrellae]|uniref:MBL fold metallo-hydrolase n=1 Tax=Paenibacillus physcomitrellae TaxID=1619311 RepID=A0ABQ1GTW1_9BACL|nr:MBL fold metallo-hydrolase [Paenibacillus physcomitrellae]GGA50328.1 MBL fold metallo-hydrolase [Paenibacillus physcomitrellae]